MCNSGSGGSGFEPRLLVTSNQASKHLPRRIPGYPDEFRVIARDQATQMAWDAVMEWVVDAGIPPTQPRTVDRRGGLPACADLNGDASLKLNVEATMALGDAAEEAGQAKDASRDWASLVRESRGEVSIGIH